MSQSPCVGLSAASRALGRDRQSVIPFFPRGACPQKSCTPMCQDFFFWDLLAVSTDPDPTSTLKPQTSSAASGPAAGEHERQRSPFEPPCMRSRYSSRAAPAQQPPKPESGEGGTAGTPPLAYSPPETC